MMLPPAEPSLSFAIPAPRRGTVPSQCSSAPPTLLALSCRRGQATGTALPAAAGPPAGTGGDTPTVPAMTRHVLYSLTNISLPAKLGCFAPAIMGKHFSSRGNHTKHGSFFAQAAPVPPPCRTAASGRGEGRAGWGRPGGYGGAGYGDTLPTLPSPSQPAGPPGWLLPEGPSIEQHSSMKYCCPPSTAAGPEGVGV